MYANTVSLVTVDSSRPLANFHPTIWGDYFLARASNVMAIDYIKKQEHDELKEKVRTMLRDIADDDRQILELINAVQRLGVSYHFETEIEDAIKKLHQETTNLDPSDQDLYVAALRFRLIRQQGYAISCDIFNKFKDEEGKFKEYLITDIRGMLSLYEATFLGTHADEILDEALAFTTYHLKEFLMVRNLNSNHPDPYAKQVIHALNRPLHNGTPRLETRHFITVYQDEVSHDETLLKFAKLDFNKIQAQHREELGQLTKWWKDLDTPTKLPYARDRMVELYFWITGVYFEPRHSNARRLLTKAMCMVSLMDDTYDAYATFQESELFTKAMDRWNISCMNELPEYMQFIYGEIITLLDQIEQDDVKQERSFCVNYAKEAFKDLAKAYFSEVKWCRDRHIPTMEEYMNVLGYVSSIYPLFAVIAFVGLGDIATEEVFQWLSTKPKILRASAYTGRMMNDLVSHKFENERVHGASGADCCMKQYGVTEQDADSFLRKKIKDAWKDMNEELLEPPKDIPVTLLECMLNLARATDVLYEEKLDGYTISSSIKGFISSLFVEPILI